MTPEREREVDLVAWSVPWIIRHHRLRRVGRPVEPAVFLISGAAVAMALATNTGEIRTRGDGLAQSASPPAADQNAFLGPDLLQRCEGEPQTRHQSRQDFLVVVALHRAGLEWLHLYLEHVVDQCRLDYPVDGGSQTQALFVPVRLRPQPPGPGFMQELFKFTAFFLGDRHLRQGL